MNDRKAAQPRFSGPFWVRVGIRVRTRVIGVGLDLRSFVDPTRKCFLARKREQPTAPKILATRLIGGLVLSVLARTGLQGAQQ